MHSSHWEVQSLFSWPLIAVKVILTHLEEYVYGEGGPSVVVMSLVCISHGALYQTGLPIQPVITLEVTRQRYR